MATYKGSGVTHIDFYNTERIIVPTPDISSYSTDELERLTTLQACTARPGEYILSLPAGVGIFLCIKGSKFALKDGSIHGLDSMHDGLRRRVVSFADWTDRDPSQNAMLAELQKRRTTPKQFKVGDLVMPTSGKSWHANGSLPLPILDVGTTVVKVGSAYFPHHAARHATDAEVAAYHKAHCVSSPGPEPPISNATHAGRKVQLPDGPTAIVASSNVAEMTFKAYLGTTPRPGLVVYM